MGQKVNPIGIRLGIVKDWDSKWYDSSKNYSEYLLSDIAVRDFLFKELTSASVSRISIERLSNTAKVIIHTARPGIVIGKKGAEIEIMKQELKKLTKKDVWIEVIEIKRPDLDAKLVSEAIAKQLERRVAFRRVLKKSIQASMDAGAAGIKVQISGRVGGAEIARTEWYKEGQIPLHTLRANIQYATARA